MDDLCDTLNPLDCNLTTTNLSRQDVLDCITELPISEECVTAVRYMNAECSMQQGSAEWLDYRRRHITSTEAYTVLQGTEKTKKKLAAAKNARPYPVKTSPAMNFGHTYEPVAADIYAQQTKHVLVSVGAVEHPTMPWLSASPDRIDLTDNCLVEIKCAYSAAVPRRKIPTTHWIQMQIAMACTRMNKCKYVELSASPMTRHSLFTYDDATYFLSVRTVTFDRPWMVYVAPKLHSFALQHGLTSIDMFADSDYDLFTHLCFDLNPKCTWGTYNNKTDIVYDGNKLARVIVEDKEDERLRDERPPVCQEKEDSPVQEHFIPVEEATIDLRCNETLEPLAASPQPEQHGNNVYDNNFQGGAGSFGQSYTFFTHWSDFRTTNDNCRN